MRITKRHGTWLVLLAAGWAGDAAAVEPASALGDHMVLQRGKRAPIWGTAEAGEKVTVRFAGQAKTAAADAKGRWLVRLDPLEASTEPRELTIRGAGGAVTIRDVLVGDVCIAGGQSNMGRDVRRSWRPEGQRMDYPHIRFLRVSSRGSKFPQRQLAAPPPPSSPRRGEAFTQPNRWHVCTPRTTPECCAVGFFFAERIYKETHVPQGLLWNAWAGSTAREWIPRAGWRLRAELADTADQVDAWYPSTPIGRETHRRAVEGIAAWCSRAARAVRQGHPFPYPQPTLPEPDDGRGTGRGTTILYNGRVHPLVPYAVRGILWYQGESDYANARYLAEIEAMAESWRRLFAAPGEQPADLPFYFVQMQRCGSYMSPGVRDRQFQSYFTIPNSGMAVLLDLDMNLHPANKWDSGRRMALWALARDYGKDVAYSGPLYRGHRVEGGKVVVEFAHARGGLFIGRKNKLAPPQRLPAGKLVNLEITADGRKWVPAQSRIDGETLIVWADGLGKPTHVRYCWKSKADEPFLYSAAGLPAAQFNTTSPYALPGRPRAGAGKVRPARRPRARPAREAARPAAVELAGVLGNHCVLQRGVKVPVWGRAGAGEEITVTFAGQTKTATADAFGRWRVELDAMPASAEGRTLTAKGPSSTAAAENVYVGDVWLYLSMSFHLNDRSPLRAGEPDASTLPPICFHRASDLFEQRTHRRRPQAEFGRGARGRWTVYKAPGKYFAADAYYLGLGLASKTRVPVGVMGLGASTLESMTPPEGFRHYPKALAALAGQVATWTPAAPPGRKAYLAKIDAIEAWLATTRRTLRRADATFEDLTPPPLLPGPPEYQRAATTHYNEVVHRYTPAAVRGVILQPREQNVGDEHYAAKAAALIRGLREVMGRRDLPVCVVQMHSPHRYEINRAADPQDWATLREAQASLARSEPNVTVVATYDVDPKARDAIVIDRATRVSQWAAALVAGAEVLTGPTRKACRVEGGKVVVEFDGVGEGLMAGLKAPARPVRPAAGGALGGFELAGADGRWHAAAAAIAGRTVVVTCEKVPTPAAVRYAWAPQPTDANLYNRAGLPALPFATSAGESAR